MEPQCLIQGEKMNILEEEITNDKKKKDILEPIELVSFLWIIKSSLKSEG